MQKELELEHFHGPLDLLLELVESQKMEITTISLAHVAEQFLAYLEEVEERSAQELADFLVVATRLLLIKSRALLPLFEDDEGHDPDYLAAQLRMYKIYADATHAIEEIYHNESFLYSKKKTKALSVQRGFFPPEDLDTLQLHRIYQDVLARLEPVVRIPKSAIAKVVTLREKITQIQQLIVQQKKVGFHDLLSESSDSADVVVTFLAVLEMTKQHLIAVRQEGVYTDIVIESVEK